MAVFVQRRGEIYDSPQGSSLRKLRNDGNVHELRRLFTISAHHTRDRVQALLLAVLSLALIREDGDTPLNRHPYQTPSLFQLEEGRSCGYTTLQAFEPIGCPLRTIEV